jgi:hypothetical protein
VNAEVWESVKDPAGFASIWSRVNPVPVSAPSAMIQVVNGHAPLGAQGAVAGVARVGEGEPRRPGLARVALVDLRGGAGGALERRCDAAQGDVVADDLVGAVDPVVERAGGPGLAGVGTPWALNTMSGVAIAVNMLVNEVGSGTSAF